MKLTKFFLTLVYASFAYGIQVGSFYISKLSGEPCHKSLIRSSGKAATAQFLVDDDASIILLEAGRCLNFDKTGKFVLTVRPREGFRLRSIPGTNRKYILTYDGSDEFYLCADDQVSISKSCLDARQVEITFLSDFT